MHVRTLQTAPLIATLGAALALIPLLCGPVEAKGKRRGRTMASRLGIVVFQFDDGTVGHYTYGFRILEKCGLKGSFGVVTGGIDKPHRLTSAQIREMQKVGHEIHDHTLHHDAAFWGNVANEKEWPARIKESLAILKKLGIKTRGWNQPGGKGQGWSEELRRTLAKHYDYAAGRVALRSEQSRNIHWRLRDDPLSLGRGGVVSWGYNGGKGDPFKEVECIKTKIADGIRQGLVTIPLWHVLKEEDKTAWSLEDICMFVRDNKLPTMVMADAVKAIRNPRDHFDKRIEQMPNPTFGSDIDGNDRPDGYLECSYAPADVKARKGGRAAVVGKGTQTCIYGPEPGRTRFTFMARSADGATRTITPVLTFTEIDGNYQYTVKPAQRCDSLSVGPNWQAYTCLLNVGEEADRVRIGFDVRPQGEVYLSAPSWRLVK